MSSTSKAQAPAHHLIARAIIWKDGRLLANRARNAGGQPYAALPGGHVDPGEDCKLALAREMEEELQARVQVGELVLVSEAKYLGGKRGDKPRHEIVLFFQAELLGDLEEADGRIASPEPQKNFGWVAPQDWEAFNLVPHALRDVLNGASTQRYSFLDQIGKQAGGS